MDMGRKLKQVRRLKGMSLRQLAKRVDVSASFLSQVEQGKCQPSLESLSKLSAALDVTVDYLLREEQKTVKEMLELKLPNRLEYLAAVASLVTHACEVHRVVEQDRDDILLAVDEACTNIIKYAYDVGSLDYFTIRLTFEPDMILIEFQDRGNPFNPLDVEPPKNIREGVKNRNLGGLGIFLIRKVMDRTEYRYSADRGNCLILGKELSDSSGRETGNPS
jgi:anti-sigma regulatory factor (Ser/Thr protein kinase)/DNA-binding Xre family transcriptional regulator